MSSKPRTPYRRKGDFQSRNQPRGAFISGAWHCDCDPRLPAEHFKVKKAGPNNGRWFYTCQRKTCGFFLWDDDAKPREAAAVLSNSRNEPEDWHRQDDTYSSSTTLRNATSSRDSLPSPPPTNDTRALKRKIEYDDEDAFYGWSATGEENQRLAEAVEAAATPSRARDDLFTTPKRRKLPWTEDGGPTALADPKQSLLTPSKQIINTPSVQSSEGSSRQQAPDATPTPTRFRNADTSTGLDQLEEEVMGIFQEHNVRMDQATQQAVRQSFANYNRKVQGYIQGRDMLRLTVKAKEAKITELQYCISTLEAEREIDRAIIHARRHGQDS